MKRVLQSSEVVETRPFGRTKIDVFATADASYDETKSDLCVDLDSFLRSDNHGNEHVLQAPWLPKKWTVHEHVPQEESVEMAKEIFQSWTRKVRRSVPALIPDSKEASYVT